VRKNLQVAPILMLSLLLLLQGCGPKEWKAKVVPARGSISINGSPAEGVMVTLSPRGDQVDKRETQPWGVSSTDGTFTLTTYEFEDGAPEGTYDVLVRWPDDVHSMDAIDMLDGAYSRPDKSQWQVTVIKGTPELPPIRIDGARLRKPPVNPPQATPANGVRPNHRR